MKNDPPLMPTASIMLKDKLNLETACISWSELQPYFARGNCIYVASDLDLIHIAYLMANDDANALRSFIQKGQVSQVRDDQAHLFYQQNQSMWTVVVAPFVLVQPKSDQPNIVQQS